MTILGAQAVVSVDVHPCFLSFLCMLMPYTQSLLIDATSTAVVRQILGLPPPRESSGVFYVYIHFY